MRPSSIDVVFAFQAAHHFGEQIGTLTEVHRVLRHGGTLLYLYEPTVARCLHSYAVHRANRVRNEEVHEDLLVWRELEEQARQVGLSPVLSFRNDLQKTSLKRAAYYAMLNVVPTARRLLPHATDMVFTKLA